MKKVIFRGTKILVIPHARGFALSPWLRLMFPYRYEVRHSDYSQSKPSTIEKSVIANFWGTVLSNIQLLYTCSDYIILTKEEIKCFTS